MINVNDDEMRKEFEKWCIDNDLSYQMSFGQYHNATTSNYWRIWKASRKAMKPIKLPDATFETPSGDNAFREDAVINAIQQAGYEVEE